ncbi:hypothetical protein D8B26_002173 [Coccidioides posadasii str. Silveira]|uniref:Transient receptor potential ion channel protein n=3 Tax=Coccidioides posadasii TaxID=199306 RepID=E9CV85_COCPS|nr:Transient receptor potential (TRP) domain containing protein [Coccidioides posadasii C735 delta SOWgp]EER24005.1 Transient receptor potential (TRP) domain containing protein [Coccidioides posadasii C735 delta SOWgp]EFW22085.1 transient receptor potential ion channel protein [Coccidioides posadasii str. Silveira]KMM65551.1 hypothetical protein CPAG_01899 [Coccidioides posadasii RMSCC 3488]QVM07474.1 hypothetical protein D8B26_002173 [Coccidioides posadasii str. Silveira]|eukprot:XP_003066150.1 Transient receptor potential (TRP) domain containing protein [Coccidioides posadasii C735 delta SOWgp]
MGLGRYLAVTPLVWAASCNLALAGDVLKTNGFLTCLDDADIKVERLDISFDRSTNRITFDVAGSSSKEQEVTASLVVNAYGQRFTQEFDPCDEKTKVDQLCPVPARSFAAKDSVTIPSDFIGKIPSIAFAIPDLQAEATLELKARDNDKPLACIQSVVGNGKTLESPAVSYAAAGIAGAALALTGVSAAMAGGAPGAASTGPSFGDVLGWFHTMAMNGMLSVNYPPVYRSFTKNFGFSTGLIPWFQMQSTIDDFRNRTGGNLTHSNVAFLRNATLIFGDNTNSKQPAKRDLGSIFNLLPLAVRDVEVTENTSPSDDKNEDGINHVVSRFKAYAEQLSIPEANTFMTVLLVFAIIVAGIAVGILLFKLILEIWALKGNFPQKLTNFRKHYWGLLARTITNLILLLYGIWTLYCIFQFTHGDSWAAKILAGVTLAIFTAVLGYFTFRIWSVARRHKKMDGDASALYEDKETWRKYSLFYDNYKKGYWWIFIPYIFYMFAKGCILAAGDGHGLVQSGAQLVVEALMLILLLWARPYETKSSQWINISIQVVRVLSVACIIVFVQELGMGQTTKTVTGVALVAVQSALTGILALLIAINAIILLVRKNPHVQRRKESEKYDRDLDNLTPLDARNSLLLNSRTDPNGRQDLEVGKLNMFGRYEPYRDIPPGPRHQASESTDHLVPHNDYGRVGPNGDGIDSNMYPDYSRVGRAY